MSILSKNIMQSILSTTIQYIYVCIDECIMHSKLNGLKTDNLSRVSQVSKLVEIVF